MSAAATASVSQGQSASVPINVTRSKYEGTITFAVDGLPQGATANFTPGTLTGTATAASLTFTAATSATPGTSNLTLRAFGTGVAAVTSAMTLTVNVTGRFTLAVQPADLVMQQGITMGGSVAVTRIDGFAGTVALAATNLPAGVSVTFSEPALTGNSSTFTITTSSNTPVGQHTITITATTPGLAPETATFALRVITPPPARQISLDFCANTPITWFGFRNEGANWVRVQPTSANTYNFAASDRVVLGYVLADARGSGTSVYYVTAADLEAFNGITCQEAGSKTLNGSATGFTVGDNLEVSMGRAPTRSLSTNGTTTQFSISGLADGPLDLLAVRTRQSASADTPDRFILRRSINQPNGATLPALDFDGAEAFAPLPTRIRLTGLSQNDVAGLSTSFATATTLPTASTSSVTLIGATEGTIYAVPAANLVAGDLQEVALIAFSQSAGPGQLRVSIAYYRTPADRTMAVPPVLNAATITTLASSPHLRLRASVASQPEFATAMDVELLEPRRSVSLLATAGYFGGTPATWNLDIPDFSSAPGFDPSWHLSTATPQFGSIGFAATRASLILGAPSRDGDVLSFAFRGSIFGNQISQYRLLNRSRRSF